MVLGHRLCPTRTKRSTQLSKITLKTILPEDLPENYTKSKSIVGYLSPPTLK